MIRRVRAQAPCRVDLAGGTLDLWPLGLLHPGACTVNFAVDLLMAVEIGPGRRSFRVQQGDEVVEEESLSALLLHPSTALIALVAELYALEPFEMKVKSSSPLGAGLGASSALAVALIAACEEASGVERSGTEGCVHIARDVEAQLMKLPTGIQDHYPAVLGGALRIDHRVGGEQVTTLGADLDQLGRHLLLVYTGQSHVSAENNWQIVRRRLDGEKELGGLFAGIADVASRMADALEVGDLEQVGGLMNDEWQLRCRLSPSASTPTIGRFLQLARAAGAWGGRACGAGGGGCVAIVCPPASLAGLARDLEEAGGVVLPCVPTPSGLRVEAD